MAVAYHSNRLNDQSNYLVVEKVEFALRSTIALYLLHLWEKHNIGSYSQLSRTDVALEFWLQHWLAISRSNSF